MLGSLLAGSEGRGARSEGPLSPQPPAPRLPALPRGCRVALCSFPTSGTCKGKPVAWLPVRVGPQRGLAPSRPSGTVMKPSLSCPTTAQWGFHRGSGSWTGVGCRPWSRVGSYRPDSLVVTGRFLLVCVPGPCPQGLFRKALLSAGEWGRSLGPGACSQGCRGPCRK